MATAGVELKITGLKEFQKALRKADKDLPKLLRLALNNSAAAVIALALPGVPVKTGRARRSLRAGSTQRLARVKGGNREAPHYPWLDFGGRVGKYNQVEREFLTDGRYIYPAYFSLRDSGNFEKILENELTKVCEQAGLDVD